MTKRFRTHAHAHAHAHENSYRRCAYCCTLHSTTSRVSYIFFSFFFRFFTHSSYSYVFNVSLHFFFVLSLCEHINVRFNLFCSCHIFFLFVFYMILMNGFESECIIHFLLYKLLNRIYLSVNFSILLYKHSEFIL